jgi:hypothetical protein
MLPSLSGGKGPNVSIDNFFHWDTGGDRERFTMAYMEVCDNLWQEGQEETKYPTSCLTLDRLPTACTCACLEFPNQLACAFHAK